MIITHLLMTTSTLKMNMINSFCLQMMDVVLKEKIRSMDYVDVAIEVHGGWPIK